MSATPRDVLRRWELPGDRCDVVDSVEGVVQQLAFLRERYGLVDTSVRPGDESGSGVYHDEEAVLFRTGMAMVAVTLADGSGRLTGDRYQALLPAATAIAEPRADLPAQSEAEREPAARP